MKRMSNNRPGTVNCCPDARFEKIQRAAHYLQGTRGEKCQQNQNGARHYEKGKN